MIDWENAKQRASGKAANRRVIVNTRILGLLLVGTLVGTFVEKRVKHGSKAV
jgi:hypothetical protein